MLIRFSVSNFLSIKDEATLSMVAANVDTHMESTFDPGLPQKGPSLLKGAAIYGPNASGKSNLINALGVMRQLVLKSHRHQTGESLDVEPFKLDPELRKAPSRFEVEFVEDRIRFVYGIELTNERIVSEWLTAYPKSRAQMWFRRIYSPETDSYEYNFYSDKLEGSSKREWGEETLDNALFLSKAVQNNHQQLRPVFNWFRNRLTFAGMRSSAFEPSNSTVSRLKADASFKPKLIKFLETADISIADIRVMETPIDMSFFPESLPEDVKASYIRETGGVITDTKTYRKDAEGNLISFGLFEESDGTRTLFNLSSRWLDVLEHDRVLIVDELDSSLHPLVVHELVRQFNQSPSRAQIVFTTHDSTLLGKDILRRDQIWFVEKDRSGSSHLYALFDFKPRKGEAIEKGYLNGRYGSIPFIGELARLEGIASED